MYLLKECEDNLYPYYKDFNLVFLKGYCTIFRYNLLNEIQIKFVDRYDLNVNFEERLKNLFKIKKTWILEELLLFMAGFGMQRNYIIEKLGLMSLQKPIIYI